MNKQFFDGLNLSAKAEILFEEGRVISDRNEAEHRITLYQLYSFFVEVYCDLNFTMIEKVKLVTSEEALKAYNKLFLRSSEDGLFAGTTSPV